MPAAQLTPRLRPGAVRVRVSVALAVLLSVIALALTPAAEAMAAGGALPDTRYFTSHLSAITPAVPGLEVAVGAAGESISLTYRGSSTVEVLGYTGEPYLRISPQGVDENVASISSLLNGSLLIQGIPQDGRNGEAKPTQWVHRSDRPEFRWHDHRMHWMSDQRPPVVAADPTQPHHVLDWTIHLLVDGSPALVEGALDWTGEPPFSPWGLLPAALVVLLAVAGVSYSVIRVARRPPAQVTPDRHEPAGTAPASPAAQN